MKLVLLVALIALFLSIVQSAEHAAEAQRHALDSAHHPPPARKTKTETVSGSVSAEQLTAGIRKRCEEDAAYRSKNAQKCSKLLAKFGRSREQATPEPQHENNIVKLLKTVSSKSSDSNEKPKSPPVSKRSSSKRSESKDKVVHRLPGGLHTGGQRSGQTGLHADVHGNVHEVQTAGHPDAHHVDPHAADPHAADTHPIDIHHPGGAHPDAHPDTHGAADHTLGHPVSDPHSLSQHETPHLLDTHDTHDTHSDPHHEEHSLVHPDPHGTDPHGASTHDLAAHDTHVGHDLHDLHDLEHHGTPPHPDHPDVHLSEHDATHATGGPEFVRLIDENLDSKAVVKELADECSDVAKLEADPKLMAKCFQLLQREHKKMKDLTEPPLPSADHAPDDLFDKCMSTSFINSSPENFKLCEKLFKLEEEMDPVLKEHHHEQDPHAQDPHAHEHEHEEHPHDPLAHHTPEEGSRQNHPFLQHKVSADGDVHPGPAATNTLQASIHIDQCSHGAPRCEPIIFFDIHEDPRIKSMEIDWVADGTIHGTMTSHEPHRIALSVFSMLVYDVHLKAKGEDGNVIAEHTSEHVQVPEQSHPQSVQLLVHSDSNGPTELGRDVTEAVRMEKTAGGLHVQPADAHEMLIVGSPSHQNKLALEKIRCMMLLKKGYSATALQINEPELLMHEAEESPLRSILMVVGGVSLALAAIVYYQYRAGALNRWLKMCGGKRGGKSQSTELEPFIGQSTSTSTSVSPKSRLTAGATQFGLKGRAGAE